MLNYLLVVNICNITSYVLTLYVVHLIERDTVVLKSFFALVAPAEEISFAPSLCLVHFHLCTSIVHEHDQCSFFLVLIIANVTILSVDLDCCLPFLCWFIGRDASVL